MVLDLLTSGKSMSQASRECGIKDSVLARWKQEFIEQSPKLFAQDMVSDGRDQRIAELERLVGRLTLELDAVHLPPWRAVPGKRVSGYGNTRSKSDAG